MYTKGDWEVTKGLVIVAKDKYVSAIAEVCANSDNAKANAQLIASAPDLYEALKEAKLNWIKTGKYLPVPILQAMDKALAKAEGK